MGLKRLEMRRLRNGLEVVDVSIVGCARSLLLLPPSLER